MKSRKTTHILLFLLALSACSAIWSGIYHQQQVTDSRYAKTDYAKIYDLTVELRRLQASPQSVDHHKRDLEDLTRLIESSVTDASISAEHLIKVWPEHERRLDDSAYLEKPTQILLRNVTLSQTVSCLHSLTTQDTGLIARSIRLTASRESNPETDLWNLESTLSYLIYDPHDN